MPNEKEDREVIESNHRTYSEAMRKGDVAGLVSLFSPTAVLMPPNDTTLYGAAEIQEWFEEYFAHFRITALGETQYDLTLIGDYAIERGEFMVSLVPIPERSKRIRDDGRFLTVYGREADGRWSIRESMWNSQKPVGAGTHRFMARMLQKNAAKKSQGA